MQQIEKSNKMVDLLKPYVNGQMLNISQRMSDWIKRTTQLYAAYKKVTLKMKT